MVARDRDRQLARTLADQLLLDERERLPRTLLLEHRVLRLLHPDPTRLCSREDHTVAVLEIGSSLAEVLELWPVQVGVELDVCGPKPPAIGQAKDEVATALARPPRPDPRALGEETGEARQSVIPVVISRDREEMRHLLLGQVR